MTSSDSQNLESYVPIYDAAPSTWEEAQPYIVENLKKLSIAINIREIGWYLDEELLSGKAFLPGLNSSPTSSAPIQYRTILRKVIVFSNLAVGANSEPHGIDIDSNFSLIQLFGAATNETALTGQPLPNGADTISYTATNIVITVAAAWTRAYAVIEYIVEL